MASAALSAEHLPRLKNLCRMCASTCLNPMEIYGPQGIENELAVKFSSYLPLPLSASDTLPLLLCYECTNLLIQWDAAVLVAIAADKKLRALQWREQQSHQFNKEKTEELNQQQKENRQSLSGESLCCSVCSKSGMGFRELVKHLKSHDMPNEEPNTLLQDHTSSDSELVIDEELLQPIICLETPTKGRGSSPVKRNSEGEKKGSASQGSEINNTRRIRRKRSKNPGHSTLSDAEGDSGDPMVTSSTNGSSTIADSHNSMTEEPTKSADNSNRDSSQQPTFKPKVRIISAESINQTLEERAKANQQARKEELEKSQSVVDRSLQPARGEDRTSSSKWTKIVIPGSLVKAMNSPDNSPTKPKFLKLSDGRVIRLLGNVNKPDSSHKAVFASGPLVQKIPQHILNKLSSGGNAQEKLPAAASSSKSLVSPPPSSPVSPVMQGASGGCDDNSATTSPLKHNVKLSSSRIVTFNLQPGPKNSLTRYTCAFCGKRNLLQETLHEHAQQHTPAKTKKDSVTNVSPLSESVI